MEIGVDSDRGTLIETRYGLLMPSSHWFAGIVWHVEQRLLAYG
ncbi:MAG TPA: hypothetical protein VFA32_17985 [Dehalococcoidia bacterium]|nr:hypothetical protein [Dehalococcoidia bacterium]